MDPPVKVIPMKQLPDVYKSLQFPLHALNGSLFYLVPAGVLLTSAFLVMRKRITGIQSPETVETADEETNDFNTYIRKYFVSQGEQTMDYLKRMSESRSESQPQLLVFFTTEVAAPKALDLATKMLCLLLKKHYNNKTLEEIEQDHVVSGQWYNRFTISYYFLKELNISLARKTGLIINNFQDVHPNSAALLTFKASELLDGIQDGYLFLIIVTDPDCLTSVESATLWWLNEKLSSSVREDVLEGIRKEVEDKACIIAN